MFPFLRKQYEWVNEHSAIHFVFSFIDISVPVVRLGQSDRVNCHESSSEASSSMNVMGEVCHE